ncbi:hypothetical protein O3M35_004898 [Rhynocoris fuscipes]|uniref:Proline-rich protein PRCC n=1 Tax=Rhynocoris fuscipes TaxID=488301 RepID=A0AAW1DJZ3_9HEMI
MALVSYDCSDSSDFEDNDEQKDELENKISEVTIVNKIDNLETKEEKKPFDDDDLNKKSTSSLPPPVEIKSNFNVVSWNLLTKNRTQPIRISIPSLEDDNEIEDTKPKLKPSSKKSGLFAILPKPKQHLLVPPSLRVPNQVKKKPEVKKPLPSVKSSAKVNPNSKKAAPQVSSSTENLSDDDDEQPQSFFFLPEEKGVEDKFNFEDIDKEIMGASTPLDEKNVAAVEHQPDTSAQIVATDESQAQMSQYSSDASEVELDKEALEKLCGRRGKRLAGEIEMVNVSGAELVGDSKLWLAKDLTTQKVHAKKAKFDPLQRRKHQITFLAAHAREQELELSNQWANNRMTRKQTQAKYGF